MVRQIPEADWRHWKKTSGAALERFCEKILKKAAGFERGSGSAHARYQELFKYIKKSDDTIAEVFDNPRRSSAYIQIAKAVQAGMVEHEELSVFSEETKAVLDLLLGRRRG